MLKTALKPKWIAALVFALAVAAAFVLLSQWQFSRSLEKDVAPPSVTEVVQPLLEILPLGEPLLGSAEGQLVRVEGHFDPAKEVIVESRLQDGVKGYWVVTAFVVDGAPVLDGIAATPQAVIPVARGWLEDPADATAAPTGQLTLEGRLLNSEGPVLKRDLPAGQVAALSSAELTNRWEVSTYTAFIVSFEELADGADVSAGSADSTLTQITVTATDQNDKINWLNIFYSLEWVLFAGFAVFLWWRLVADDFRRDQDELFDIDAFDELDADPADTPEPGTDPAAGTQPDAEPGTDPAADPATPTKEH